MYWKIYYLEVHLPFMAEDVAAPCLSLRDKAAALPGADVVSPSTNELPL
jgi:hypothetical protein